MASNYKRIGNFIRQVDVRNTDARLGEEDLYGLSVYKEFIPTHANLVGVKFNGYKIVAPGQFTYIPDTSRRGDKIAIGLNGFGKDIIVSSVYTVFEIYKPDELNAEYLMMLFRNPEYDRFARYNSWGSAREVFSWEDFCDSELYIPDIEEQHKIVRQYKTVTDRICVLDRLNNKLEELADNLHTDFINSHETLDGIIGDIGEFVRGKNITAEKMVYGDVEVISAGLKASGMHNKWNVTEPSITISGSGVNAGYFSLHYEKIWAADCSYCNNIQHIFYLYESLKNVKDKIEELKDGHSAQQHVYPKDVNIIPTQILDESDYKEYDSLLAPIFAEIEKNVKEIKQLTKIKNVLIESCF